MDTLEHTHSARAVNIRTVTGIALILAGGLLFLDRYLRTGWLSLVILPVVGIFLYLWGIRSRHSGMIITGGLLCSIGAGVIAAWGPAININQPGKLILTSPIHPLLAQIGQLTLLFGLGWGIVLITIALLRLPPIWWALVPSGILVGFGYCLVFSPVRWVDFVFYLALGIGFPLLVWGLITRLIGLVIPGCLVLGIGPGIYQAWQTSQGNSLTQTGIMLIWFAVGWIMISAGSKFITNKYIWWPLIPGGILAMIGMGLYIGGDPGHALGFISNTGSIALMIFGLYLLLMRKGIHH